MSSSSKFTLTLQSIICLKTSEMGSDELYIKYVIDGGKEVTIPTRHDMKEGYEWTLNMPFTYQKTLKIELWDHDSVSRDDNLGSHTYSSEDASKYLNINIKQPNKKNGSNYKVFTTPALVLVPGE